MTDCEAPVVEPEERLSHSWNASGEEAAKGLKAEARLIFILCLMWFIKKLELVRAGGLEPPQALRPNGFSCHLRLSPPPSGVCGLDYPFTLPRIAPGLRCCPSSLYTFPNRCVPSGLGSGLPCERFPRI